ncbi:MAG: hypothetical protein M1818_007261 [Claussenomyces sp. TS43310]|nr:MAG: hypothetical protein M1818_007261 [Claussenomyces sp. TS43310]
MAADAASKVPFIIAPAPWYLGCQMWAIPVKSSSTLPEHAYAPIEAASAEYSDPAVAGKFNGGMGAVVLVRYHKTPVGPYDELLILPGKFQVGNTSESAYRLTSVYVSQKDTTYNGRKNWNIPKNLARFSFTPVPGSPKATKVEVWPEHSKSETPFFQTILQPIPYVPSFPCSSKVLSWLGLKISIVQPPMPQSDDPNQQELTGTDSWYRVFPASSGTGTLMWADLEQPKRALGAEGVTKGYDLIGSQGLENFWPGSSKWNVAFGLRNAIFEIPSPSKVEV